MWNDAERDQHYGGTFNLAGDSVEGEMIYNKQRGVIMLSLIKQLPDAPSLGKTYGNLDIISGVLHSGTTVTLFNNRCIKNSTHAFRAQKIIYVAEYSIWSKDVVLGAKYNEMVCVLENGLDWSGISAIDVSDSSTIKIKEQNKGKTYHWFGARIAFFTSLNCELLNLPRPEEAKVVERLAIRIETDEKRDASTFIALRNKVIALISFAIKDNINVEKQYLIDVDDFVQTGDYKDYTKHYMYTSGRRLNMQHNKLWDFNFTLSQLDSEKDIHNELDLLSPIFNLYLSLFKYEDMPIEMIFLNVVQALETFHARFFYDNSKEKYVESVKERFGELPNYEDIERIMINDTQKDENCTYIILVSRLIDLLIGNNNGIFVDYYITDPEFAQRVSDTRHYYTHYGKAKEKKALKGQLLIDAIRVLALLLEYNVCLKLGIDNEERVKTALGRIESWKQFHRGFQKNAGHNDDLS